VCCRIRRGSHARSLSIGKSGIRISSEARTEFSCPQSHGLASSDKCQAFDCQAKPGMDNQQLDWTANSGFSIQPRSAAPIASPLAGIRRTTLCDRVHLPSARLMGRGIINGNISMSYSIRSFSLKRSSCIIASSLCSCFWIWTQPVISLKC
jgi:hypothetical protein